ncbi:MAG: hypothetical protein ABI672_20665 [Vicinamibacteria bacterium]
MADPDHDRRRFLLTALAGTATLPCAPADAAQVPDRVSPRSGSSGLDGLNLTPEVKADIEAFAQPVLQDVAYLSELALDDLEPALVFVPRR